MSIINDALKKVQENLEKRKTPNPPPLSKKTTTIEKNNQVLPPTGSTIKAAHLLKNSHSLESIKNFREYSQESTSSNTRTSDSLKNNYTQKKHHRLQTVFMGSGLIVLILFFIYFVSALNPLLEMKPPLQIPVVPPSSEEGPPPASAPEAVETIPSEQAIVAPLIDVAATDKIVPREEPALPAAPPVSEEVKPKISVRKPEPDIIINGVMIMKDKPIALINNDIYEVGETIQGMEIVDITGESVHVLKDGEIQILKVKK